MSGFSSSWLDLREAADHRARDGALLRRLGTSFAGRDAVSVVDLGCGLGSNLRAIAGVLPKRQHWRLVDHDRALLAAARERLAAWADAAEGAGADLNLRKGNREIGVSFVAADLSQGVDAALGASPDLVTAAALFDLCSAAWIERFAAAVAASGAVFYTALTYDGREVWEPAHPADAAVLAAFHAHQGGDKGFGPSAGPRATQVLAQAFGARGYRIETADSAWRLGPDDAALLSQLADGAAAAVRETGRVADETVASWLTARRSGATCTVGHQDLIALTG